ncbi:hypothetical protein MMC06_005979 [Schaereria dolodes]|nr:hypothetical protein [Schaereria dolodes]
MTNARYLDVAILYQIIATAHQSSNVDSLPFRALFAAYDQVLALHGIDPDHDQIYLRFLFRLGNRRRQGRTLYENFETLLGELGIQLDFGVEDDVTRTLPEVRDIKNGPTRRPGNAPRGRSRRASFSSVYDVEDETTRAGRRLRDSSRASLSRVQPCRKTQTERRTATNATFSATRDLSFHPRINEMSPLQGRLAAEEFAGSLQRYQGRLESTSSQGSCQSRHGSPHLKVSNTRARSRFPVDTNQDMPLRLASDVNTNVSSLTSSVAPEHVDVPQEMLYNLSRIQLFRDADTFKHYYTRSVARNVFRRWRSSAPESKLTHQKLYFQASIYDSGVLIRQAYDHWRVRFLAIRQALETERFFSYLELRASRARDLYLLTKAFTHWADCALGEVHRTSIARRHIVRTRYFNVWREITVINHSKVRHQRLRKFLGVWSRQFQDLLTNNTRASTVYYESLARNAYWYWFWTFCQTRAPEWRDARLKKRHFFSWLFVGRRNVQRQRHIMKASKGHVQRQSFGLWLERTHFMCSCIRQATHFREKALIAHHVPEWKRRLHYAPLIRLVSNMIDWRVARATFGVMISRYILARQAAYINQSRIARNAWTAWNDYLRCQTLVHRIDDRVLLRALYRWVLLERLILLQRLYEQRLKRKVLLRLESRIASLRIQEIENACLVQKCRDRICLISILETWNAQIRLFHKHAQLAFYFEASLFARPILKVWSTSQVRNQRMHGWARYAAFYFQTSKTFRRWQDAVISAHHEKRRKAYAQVRRRTKLDLAARIMHKWRQAARDVFSAQMEAQGVELRRALIIGSALFYEWKNHGYSILEQEQQVVGYSRNNLVRQCIRFWRVRSQIQGQMQGRARFFANLHVSKTALGSFRKLQMRLLTTEKRSEIAESVQHRNDRCRQRSLFRKWMGRTSRVCGHVISAQPSIILAGDPEDGNRSIEQVEFPHALEQDFNLSDWIPALESQSSSTLLRGDISTPSRRAACTRASSRISTTPATPIAGLFARISRLQMNTNTGLSRRRDLAKSSLGTRLEGFDDILEARSSTSEGR